MVFGIDNEDDAREILKPTVDSRAEFEAWISAPPYEQCTNRFSRDGVTSWSGQYHSYQVQLAWEAWQAARR